MLIFHAVLAIFWFCVFRYLHIQVTSTLYFCKCFSNRFLLKLFNASFEHGWDRLPSSGSTGFRAVPVSPSAFPDASGKSFGTIHSHI